MVTCKDGEEHKIFSKEEIRIALEDYAVNGTYVSAGRALQAFKCTDKNMTARAKAIILKYRYTPEFADIFAEKQLDFKHRTLLVAEKAVRLMDVKIDLALENANELKRLLCEIGKDEELSKSKKEELIKKLNTMRADKLSELSVVAGTMYDKHRLASNESTNNNELKVSYSGDIDEFGA